MQGLKSKHSQRSLITGIEEEIRIIQGSKDEKRTQVQSEHIRKKYEILCSLLEQIKEACPE